MHALSLHVEKTAARVWPLLSFDSSTLYSYRTCVVLCAEHCTDVYNAIRQAPCFASGAQ